MPAPTMSRQTPARRRVRRFGPLVAALALVTVISGACVGQRDPTGYSASVREDFVDGCLAGYAPSDGGKDPALARNTELCGCIYDQMANKSKGIPFDDFKSAQSAIRKDPSDPANSLDKLIPKFDDFVATCQSKTDAGP
ncbi:MAG TPA: hypothetical protein VFN21_00270 [Acidimicrobiales bacterium]|nr:hypothetical protein [Acidimicrobiales bacterium]